MEIGQESLRNRAHALGVLPYLLLACPALHA
ncbi:MAG: DUF2933 domain-containing protein [Gammaproteobacteria bacterium]